MPMRYELKKLLGARWLRLILLLTAAYALFIPWHSSGGLNGLMEQRRMNRLTAAVSAAEAGTDAAGLVKRVSAAENELFSDLEHNAAAPGTYGLGETAHDDWIALRRAADAAVYAEQSFPMHRVQITERLLRQNTENSDIYASRVNAFALRKYNRYLTLTRDFSGSVTQETHFLFHYTLWEYVMLMLSVLLGVRMFTLDRQTGAYRVIAASESGMRGRFFRQFGAVTVVLSGMTLFVLAAEITAMVVVYGVRDFSLPVQQWPLYEMCPMKITLGGMLILQTVMRFLVYVFAAAVSGMLAILIRKTLAANALGILLCTGGLLWHMTYILRLQTLTESQQQRFAALRTWLPQSLLHPMSHVSGIDCANICGFPADRLTFCAMLCCICTAAMLMTARRLCGRRER